MKRRISRNTELMALKAEIEKGQDKNHPAHVTSTSSSSILFFQSLTPIYLGRNVIMTSYIFVVLINFFPVDYVEKSTDILRTTILVL